MFGHGGTDQQRHLGRSGEGHTTDARIAGQGRAHLPVTRQQLQCRGRDARLVQKRHRQMGDERGLFGGLGDHRIAGGQRRPDLAREDRQWEVPR